MNGRVFALALWTAGGFLAPRAAADEALPDDYRACIEQNAVAVEKLGEPVTASVAFLTTEICAEPLAQYAAAKQAAIDATMKARMVKYCEAMKARKKDSRDVGATNDDTVPMCGSTDVVGGDDNIYSVFTARALSPPAAATSLASQELLNLRLKQTSPQP